MSGFAILDLVLGMIFIYFLLSMICSSAVELWFTLLRTRAKILEQWLISIFNLPALNSHGEALLDLNNKPMTLGQAIMDHCMVTVLSGKGRATSYIDAGNFYSALMDKITLTPSSAKDLVQLPPKTLDEYIVYIQNSISLSGELKRTFLMLAFEAKQASTSLSNLPAGAVLSNNLTSQVKSELDHFRQRIEAWYESNTRRLTGTLKRTKAAPSTFILATAITIGLNADSIDIGKYLYDHKEETRQFADQAANSLRNFEASIQTVKEIPDSAGSSDASSIRELDEKLSQVKNDIRTMREAVPQGLPIGWKSGSNDWINHLAGWIVTILAICIGAPFWFEILNKIANLRGTGPKPGASPVESN